MNKLQKWINHKVKIKQDLTHSDVDKAKEMEKQQMIDAYMDSTCQFANDARIDYPKSAEQYYNETFNK